MNNGNNNRGLAPVWLDAVFIRCTAMNREPPIMSPHLQLLPLLRKLISILIKHWSPILIGLSSFYLAEPASGQLAGKSFSLSSSIRAYSYDEKETHVGYGLVSEAYESYSYHQQRAKIQFKISDRRAQDQPKWGSDLDSGMFYFDAKRNVKLLLDRQNQCKLSNLAEFQQIIHFETPFDEELLDDGQQAHVVGPAKLLLLSIKFRNRMQLVSLRPTYDYKNIPCLKYRYDYTTSSGELTELKFFYSESALASDKENTLPVSISLSSGRIFLVISYTNIQFFDDERENNSNMINDKQTLNLVQTDLFAFDQNCLASLQEQKNLLESIFGPFKKFSFDATVQVSSTKSLLRQIEQYSTSIAYDSELQLMRIKDAAIDGESNHISDSGKQILDFESQYAYTVLSKSSPDGGSTLNLEESSVQMMQCVKTRLPELKGRDVKPGKLLTGADKFIFMGHGRVRNIEALVYQTSLGSLPLWLDQPTTYFKGESGKNLSTLFTRAPEIGEDYKVNDLEAKELIVTVYVTVERKLLLYMELQRPIFKFVPSFDRELISIYNFYWDLPSESERGEHLGELFSLRDSCSSSSINSLSMTLKLDQAINNEARFSHLLIPSYRNQALLSSLHKNLKLSAATISNLESKFKSNQILQISYNFVSPPDNLAELFYVGQGKPMIHANKLQVFESCPSFQLCYSLAIHYKFNNYFGYNPYHRTCYVDLQQIVDHGSDSSRSFTLQANELIEIYRIQHKVEPNINPLQEGQQVKMLNQRMQLVYSEIGSSIQMSIEKFALNDFFRGKYQQTVTELQKLHGFGLVDGSESKSIEPMIIGQEIEHHATSSMTYDQCHAICLSDLDCRSFSICIQNYETKCSISKINLKFDSIRDQLKSKSVVEAKRNSKVKIKIAAKKQDSSEELEREVELLKSPNCVLYNKNLLDLFKRQRPSRIKIQDKSIYLVRDVEDCAKYCFEQTLDVLKEDVQHSLKVSVMLNENLDNPNERQIDTLKAFINEHKSKVNQLCHMFSYLDSVRFAELDEESKNLLTSNLVNGRNLNTSGFNSYCAISRREQKSPSQDSSRANRFATTEKLIHFGEYLFKIDFLYRKQYGFKVKESIKDEKTQLAYTAILDHKYNQTDLKLLKEFIDRGDNSQQMIKDDPSWCAMKCFLQYGLIWPACKSFDITISVNKHDQLEQRCYLNSISLAQTKVNNREDLIEHVSGEADLKLHQLKEVWHYEPKFVFTLGESILANNLEITLKSLELYETSRKFGLRGFGIVVTALIGAIIGLVLGLNLAREYIDYSNDRRTTLTIDTSNLVEEELNKGIVDNS